MPHLDIFKDDAFSVRSLTTAINKLPYQPQQIGQMNLFSSKPHITPNFSVEEQNGRLSLIPAEARGTVPHTEVRAKRNLRPMSTVHLPQKSTVVADEVSGIRAFGSETEVESVSKVVNDHLAGHKRNIEVTKEWQRIGAIKGVVLDADGSTVIQDLFSTFGITPVTADIDFDSPPEMKTYCSALVRSIENGLGADTYTKITAICGNRWYDSLIVMPEVKAAYDRWQNGQFLRDNQLRTGFDFGGINWVNYRGSVGGNAFLATGEAYFVVEGVSDLFEEHLAPAPFMETVNTRGQAFYSKQEMMKFDLGVELYSCSDVLMICTRPAVLIKSIGTNLEAPPFIGNEPASAAAQNITPGPAKKPVNPPVPSAAARGAGKAGK